MRPNKPTDSTPAENSKSRKKIATFADADSLLSNQELEYLYIKMNNSGVSLMLKPMPKNKSFNICTSSQEWMGMVFCDIEARPNIWEQVIIQYLALGIRIDYFQFKSLMADKWDKILDVTRNISLRYPHIEIAYHINQLAGFELC